MPFHRRDFLKFLGIGAATGVVASKLPAIVLAESEPVRRYWQVPGNAPVGLRRVVSSVDGPFENPHALLLNYQSMIAADVRVRADHKLLEGAPITCDAKPVGIIQSVNPDGTAWVLLGGVGVFSPRS